MENDHNNDASGQKEYLEQSLISTVRSQPDPMSPRSGRIEGKMWSQKSRMSGVSMEKLS